MLLASPAASQTIPGILGFLVVAALALALFFLLRSMNKHLRRVAPGPRWREESPAPQPAEDSDLSPNGNQAP
jgi:hypothetical protein